MPEMTPDPVLEKLARFAPAQSQIDAAELLFRAGRESARTPRVWKVSVLGLLLANAVTVGFLLPRDPPRPLEVIAIPVAVPVMLPTPVPQHADRPYSPDPNSVAAISRAFDPDSPPPPAGFAAPNHPDPILSVRLKGIID
jgi:hypothetical protein